VAEQLTLTIGSEMVDCLRSMAASTGIPEPEIVHRSLNIYNIMLRMSRLTDDGARMVHVVKPSSADDDTVTVARLDIQ